MWGYRPPLDDSPEVIVTDVAPRVTPRRSSRRGPSFSSAPRSGPGSEAPILSLQSDPAEPRGRRATSYGQNFAFVVGWTILGAFVPGLGLVRAGRRKLGYAVMISFMAALVAAVAYVGTGDLIQRLGAIAQPDQLMALALTVAVASVLWSAMVVGTHFALRRNTRLGLAQQLFCAVLVGSLIALVAVPAVKAGSYALILRDTANGIFTSGGAGGSIGNDSTVISDSGDPWKNIPRVNVLLIGSDAGADRTGIRPDTLILASIDTKTGETVLISLPRNLERVPFPAGSPQEQEYPEGFYCVRNGTHECLLNAFWTYGEEHWQQYYPNEGSAFHAGLRATADAVTAVTGLPVNQYVMLNLRGFQDFVNAIGGVTVNVYDRLPIGGSSKNPVATGGWIEPGLHQHLDGYRALWYARSRWSTDDFDRMRRQRCFIGAVTAQADPATVARNFPAVAAAAKDNIITGIPLSQLSAWVTLADRVKGSKVRSLPFTSRVIQPGRPDFYLMRQMVNHAIDPNSPAPVVTPTQTPSPSASPPKKSTGATNPGSTSVPTPPPPPEEDNTGTAQDVQQVC